MMKSFHLKQRAFLVACRLALRNEQTGSTSLRLGESRTGAQSGEQSGPGIR